MADKTWSWQRLLSLRLFPARENVSDSARAIYQKRWTRGLPELALKRAA